MRQLTSNRAALIGSPAVLLMGGVNGESI